MLQEDHCPLEQLQLSQILVQVSCSAHTWHQTHMVSNITNTNVTQETLAQIYWHIIFTKKNTSPYIVVIEYLITQFDICYTTAIPTLQWHSGVAKRGKHQSNSSNLNPIRILTPMPSSHRQLRQNKTVSSCQQYELSSRQSQTVFSSPQHIGDWLNNYVQSCLQCERICELVLTQLPNMTSQ